jgi:GxxExxY protein
MLSDEEQERRQRTLIGIFYDVFNELGGELPEHVCTAALERELRARGFQVGREVPVPVYYKGEVLTTLRIDMLVDGCIVIEVKSTRALHPMDRRQLYNYLRIARMRRGLLLHFGPSPRFERVRWRDKTSRDGE